MPRKKHEWYIGAKVHVIARGNHRNDIFRDETDYELYLNYLDEAMEYYKNKYKVMAYVLMTNHVHIIKDKHKLYKEFVECKIRNKAQGDELDSYSS